MSGFAAQNILQVSFREGGGKFPVHSTADLGYGNAPKVWIGSGGSTDVMHSDMGTSQLTMLCRPVLVGKHDHGDDPMRDGVVGSRQEGLCHGFVEFWWGITLGHGAGTSACLLHHR